MHYPKIQTLYERSKEHNWKVIPGMFSWPEFYLVKTWLITEKIDGRNHRIILSPDGTIEHKGRTDQSTLADFEIEGARNAVDEDLIREVIYRNDDGLYPKTTLYGELYGPKINSGGKYRDDISFRLFDIRIGEWWMQWEAVETFAENIGILTVPVLVRRYLGLPTCAAELSDLFDGDYETGTLTSYVAYADSQLHSPPEGIVARTDPILCNRRGDRIFWKLKLEDFA